MPSTGSWPVVRAAGCCCSVCEFVWFFRWAGGSSNVFLADWFVEAVGWSLDWWVGVFRAERFGCSLGLRVGGSFGVVLVDLFIDAVGFSLGLWVEGSFGETSELSADWVLKDFSVGWVVGWVGGLR